MATQLYLLTPPRIDTGFTDAFKAAIEAGPPPAVQIRLKDHTPDEIRRLAPPLIRAAQAAGAAVLLNDDPALAAELGCDGVHVGQTDGTVKSARAAMGREAMIGVTCHDSRHLAMQAGEAGADYVAFGAFYPTGTKAAPTRAGVELLEWWVELFELPCVAIGGITVDNARPLVEAGADFLAVSAGVWAHEAGPAAAVKAFQSVFDAAG